MNLSTRHNSSLIISPLYFVHFVLIRELPELWTEQEHSRSHEVKGKLIFGKYVFWNDLYYRSCCLQCRQQSVYTVSGPN